MKHAPNFTAVFIETLKRQLKRDNDPKLRELLAKYEAGKLSLIDHVIYSNKGADAVTSVDFFATDDQKAIGLRNVANAKLEEDQYFCPVIIQLLSGDLGATPTDTLLRNEPYDDIFTTGGNLNSAELDLKFNASEYLLRETGVAQMITVGSDLWKGAKILANTTIVKPNLRMEATLKTGNATAANLGVSFRMWGAITMPKA